jgi:hypothetical protein
MARQQQRRQPEGVNVKHILGENPYEAEKREQRPSLFAPARHGVDNPVTAG